MPEFTAVTFALLALLLVIGIVLGWFLRRNRCAREKIAINAGWQQQVESQKSEHDRLARQNKSLMEQISQYQASIKDSTLRAKELSDSLKETFQRRDDLQRQLKDVRSNLDVITAQRDRLQGDLRSKLAKDEATAQAIQQKDEKIHKLGDELANWQSRVPPLVDRYRVRDEEARELEGELDEVRAELSQARRDLAEARTDRDQARTTIEDARMELQSALARIAALEDVIGSEHTRIEPVGADTLPDGLDASNEPHDDTVENAFTGLRDQIDDDVLPLSSWHTDEAGEDHVPLETPDDEGPWERVPASAGGDAAGHEDDAESLDDVLLGNASPSTEATEVAVQPDSGSDAFGGQPDIGTKADDTTDDLRQIKGVGPSIEKTLHDLGFFRYSQIAEMTELDIDRVARQLKGFRSRIYREDWIGQARMLLLQKYNSRA